MSSKEEILHKHVEDGDLRSVQKLLRDGKFRSHCLLSFDGIQNLFIFR